MHNAHCEQLSLEQNNDAHAPIGIHVICLFYRSIRSDQVEYADRGPFVVGSYAPRAYLSQSSEQLPT